MCTMCFRYDVYCFVLLVLLLLFPRQSSTCELLASVPCVTTDQILGDKHT